MKTLCAIIGLLCCTLVQSLRANIPGGGTGTGPNVTLTSTDTTATMSNGTVSILITKSSANITTINYTFNNTGSNQTLNLLSGNPQGGKLYWEHSNNQGMVFTGSYTVVADPATNGGDYAEISLYSTTQADMPFAVHYSMRRGSPGFYVTAIWTHGSSNGAFGMGECRNNIYAGSIFNWMSVDATRNRLMQVSGGTSTGVPTAPVECSLWTNGIYQGQYEDKYKYSATFGDQRVWGWSSVGASGKNVGLWNVLASTEYYNGGPLKPELMSHIGTTILNMFNGSHYEMGTDGAFVAGENWGKVYGPYFVYCNNVPKTLTDPVQVSQTLYNDALEQAKAEATAWPYSWFNNANYASAANRGTVTGKIVIADPYNPNASAANLWVGLVQQPITSQGFYDFQHWMKPYQFWVHTDANGNFSIPAVIAGSNYTLYAFGAGASGTFMSQSQTGGNPGFIKDIPAAPFAVTVTGGVTTSLGNVTWTPTRVGPTVFEIGYPDRTARKFRHGEDWWVGDTGPSPTVPSPVWTKFMAYPYDFPTGPNYVVGTSRWSTDWNFIQPVYYSPTGTWNSTSSTITFNLAAAPASGTQASINLGLASDYYTALTLSVNGINLASASGLVATPSAHPSTGYIPTWTKSPSSIREGINGGFSDERLTFAGTLLKAGTNTITISQRQIGGSYFANHAMYDFLRLELTNYIPPAPAGVTAFSGNNANVVSWPAVPGATSYKVLRSTVSGSGYGTIATGVIGPVCGSGFTNANYVDATAVNGTTYYYVVQSTNTVGSSVNSSQSAGAAPSVSAATTAPSAPGGLTTTPGDKTATLNWTASTGAHYYTIKRSTLFDNGGGGYNNLGTITLANNVTTNSYTDTSPYNGTVYAYTVTASNAVGTSVDSAASNTEPVAPVPTVAPTLTATAQQNASAGTITLTWTAVPGAGGYLVQKSTSAGGPYSFFSTQSALTDDDSGLAANTTYYYQVATLNSGGTSGYSTASAITPPAAPGGLTATPGSSRVTLNWTAPAGATTYVISRATVSGGPYNVIKSGVGNISYVDRGVANGSAYYYVVASTGAGGTGVTTAEVASTPVGVASLVWTGSASTTWNTSALNWLNGGVAAAYADGQDVLFDDTAGSTKSTVVASGTVSPEDVVFNNTNAYTVTAAGLSGATGLTKLGTGKITISGANAFSGGTSIFEGNITLAGGTSNGQQGLGTGLITLDGGSLTMNGYTGSTNNSYGTLANNLSVPTGSIGTLQVTQRGGQSGSLTGGGTLNLQVNYIRGDISGDWSAFTGQINVARTSTGTTKDNFRINTTTGFGTAAINLGPYVYAASLLNSANTVTIGALSGDATAQLAGVAPNNTTPAAVIATYIVGGRNTDATFAGAITNGTSPSKTSITKTGTGRWILSGASTYTGTTLVNGGTLEVSGSINTANTVTAASGGTLDVSGTITATTVQVDAGGMLTGCGAINGNLVNNGTILVNCGSPLEITGNVTNNGSMQFISGSGLTVTGAFTNNGLLDLINGTQNLPASFTNHGTVLLSSNISVTSFQKSGTAVTLAIDSYANHTYQLMRSSTLQSGSWQNVGTVKTGTGSPLTFTDTNATTTSFYRVVIGP